MDRGISIRLGGLAAMAAAVAAALPCRAAAAPPSRGESVPGYVAPALRPWVPWVLHGHEAEACPLLATGEGEPQRACVWPGTLELTLEGKGGRFTQRVRVWAERPVALPGDEKRWPQDVTVDGVAAALVLQGDRPCVRLKPGEHAIGGAFRWDALPEALPVPQQIGLLSLSVRGARIPYPTRDEKGVVWLEKRVDEAGQERVLEVVVHRKVVDDVPLTLTTRVQLRVAGKNREELLGRALPQGFVPMSLTSPLPARLEPDGRLRVQVRPGNFTVEIAARHEGPVARLPLAPAAGPWAEEEVWVFEARPHLRQVVVEGAAALDPQQTTLAADWKKLPAYRLRPGEAMVLSEKQRGDADPAPDRLALSRTLWLDLDGRGFSFQDRLSGTLSRSWRLAMPPPSELGSVTVSDQDVLITRLSPADPPGVEVRQGQLRLAAEGRVEGRRATIPAVGWASDFQSASAMLQLPPGWRLFAASGADEVPGTWVRTWDLLDLFLLLITALATARLFGWRAGLLALLTLALIIPEPNGPRWAWLVVLACEALVRLLPGGRLSQLARLARLASIAGLALITVVFAIEHVRLGMHPILERPDQSPGEMGPGAPPEAAIGLLSAEQAAPAAAPPMVGREYKAGRSLAKKLETRAEEAQRGARAQYRYEYDASAAVQTGKGLPRWSWQAIPIRWSGPVDKGQSLRLFLIPPSVNFVLAFVRVLLAALLFLVLCSLPGGFWTDRMRRLFSRPPTAALLVLLAALAAPPARAEEVDDEGQGAGEEASGEATPADSVERPATGPCRALLEELRQRLLSPPKCHPSCASIARMSIEAVPGWLRARLEVHAQAESGVPLPGDPRGFVPRQVLLGSKPAALRRGDDGVLWILVPPGTHQVLLEGPLPASEIVTLALPMRPHRVEARAEGYTVDGIHEDGLADDSLQLTRVSGRRAGASALAPGQLPPFVRVERTLALGLSWQASTRVVRLTPPGAAVVLEVPLLPGEQVTTAGVRVLNGKVLVHLDPQAAQAEWRSALEIRTALELRATTPSFVEAWQLDASPVWHVTWTGIPTIHPSDPADRTPEWRPWPGESVTLTVARPEAVPGQTLTLTQSRLVVKPGLRSTESTLALVIRSSRGGLHPVRLPEGAEVESVTIQGRVQPIRTEGGALPLPIVPGEQQVQIAWRQAIGIATFFRVPAVDLGLPSVNADLRIEVPRERWVLFLGGAPMGPAVLFWSLLAVLFLVALGLGRLGWAPLRWWSWLLLFVGLTQVPVVVAAVPAAWLLLLEWRRRRPEMGRRLFNLRQVGVLLVTLAALGVLFFSIEQGLLGLPDMQVRGNGSSGSLLKWFADRSGPTLPRPWMVSLPLLAYRGAMLAWALWVAWSLLAWLRWGWGCFTAGGVWKPAPPRPAAPTEPLPTTEAPPPPAAG